MQCPGCTGLLVEQKHGDVFVDHCSGCDGIWFDPDELAKYVRRNKSLLRCGGASDGDFLSLTGIPAGSCPRCQNGTLRIGIFKGLSFERCDSCSGFFLSAEDIRGITDWIQPSAPSGPRKPWSLGEAAAEGTADLALDAALHFIVSIVIPF